MRLFHSVCLLLSVAGLLACGSGNDSGPLSAAQGDVMGDDRSGALAVADGKPVASPSNRYGLQVVRRDPEHPEALGFDILGADGELLFRPGDTFDDRSVTMFLWDLDERVWVYSGDTGTFFWEPGATPDDWDRHVYAESEIPAPPELRNARPDQHPR